MELFDSHCHIDFPHFDDDRHDVFARMAENDVSRIVAVSVEIEQTQRLIDLVKSRENVWFSVGVHPNHDVATEPTIEQLVSLSKHQKCVAIGETGMDFFRDDVDATLQETRFRTHLQASHITGKPVIVHMRDADEITLRILMEEDVAGCGGIMHCFSSNWTAAKTALDMGMSISFSGNVTFKANNELREVAAKVPEDMFLIETDSPYLAPVPKRGKRNEPTFVRHVAECLAEVRGDSLEHIAEVSTANALKRFNLS